MKIVVVKSPRILRGLLCRVFGIHGISPAVARMYI